MEKITRVFIFNLALLASAVIFVITDHNGWAALMMFLLFVDKL
jgi:hypothetical protein